MTVEDLKARLQAELPELLKQDSGFQQWLEQLIRQTAVTPENFDARFDRMLQEFAADRAEQRRKWQEWSAKFDAHAEEQRLKWDEQNRKWDTEVIHVQVGHVQLRPQGALLRATPPAPGPAQNRDFTDGSPARPRRRRKTGHRGIRLRRGCHPLMKQPTPILPAANRPSHG